MNGAVFLGRPPKRKKRDERRAVTRTNWAEEAKATLDKADRDGFPWDEVPHYMVHIDDPAIRERITLSGAKWVFHLAAAYYKRRCLYRFGYNFMDVFQHMMSVLGEHVHKFNPERANFATFTRSTVRLAYRKIRNDITLIRDQNDTGLIAKNPISLNSHRGSAHHGGGVRDTLGDLIVNTTSPAADETAIAEENYNALTGALFVLDSRDREWISRRYGVCGYNAHSLAEIAQHFNVDQCRARQIETLIMRKMRAHAC